MTRPTVLSSASTTPDARRWPPATCSSSPATVIDVLSAGSAPKDAINPTAIDAMAEEGIDISANQPKVLTVDAVKTSDVVITMGCGDACPIFPGKRYEDWELDDPAGQDLDAVRRIRDEIKGRVEGLIASLSAA